MLRKSKITKTQKFKCFITAVDDNTASVTLVDETCKKSYMFIPIKDLKKNKVKSKPGTIFSFILKQREEWEKVKISPIKQKPMTEEEINKLLDDFEKKYGDV